MRVFNITEIEFAINYWRTRIVPDDGALMCAPALSLLQLYGHMIFDRIEAVPEAALDAEQGIALSVALDQHELPL
ncbi:DUF3717 domain-containing protein [Xanthomonas fragariae]|uniref:DUF3717 domain-containing protein n=2 Tax=Xanthomonas fragariae TaxID=48664 RepID=A0A1Y6HFD1_9XANT|nr:DUF3717 domain-containing protein [Xanthomonas fragariae]AOD16790.1 hypothetical protein BER92_19340 [Xanthomonas fragariae]AOD20180.1 hypothetical protein BER93_19505 [Xanthomonas fragariae]ENZ95993.1 hypothetical protein O1K_07077 [Xanthomonas fragariae LMG 25863]MBL9223114.1 DUF3717 domain-containing protein [Xanthomonas fragariae]MEA5219332.1 DUF3717 domain-containing protein [Xanthomonas fragariae]